MGGANVEGSGKQDVLLRLVAVMLILTAGVCGRLVPDLICVPQKEGITLQSTTTQ